MNYLLFVPPALPSWSHQRHSRRWDSGGHRQETEDRGCGLCVIWRNFRCVLNSHSSGTSSEHAITSQDHKASKSISCWCSQVSVLWAWGHYFSVQILLGSHIVTATSRHQMFPFGQQASTCDPNFHWGNPNSVVSVLEEGEWN